MPLRLKGNDTRFINSAGEEEMKNTKYGKYKGNYKILTYIFSF